ncbi:hypothetical protein EIK77_006909 [Talaromyces pinophilus]|nr:hypothetical protein EIK77_006909 [Talaromyces pinophilus]
MEHHIDADQPLLANDSNNREDVLYESSDEPAEGLGGLFIWALTFAAGISGLLFGYEYNPSRTQSHQMLRRFALLTSNSTGVISATLVSIKTDLSGKLLTTMDKSIITSCTSLFALIASPLAGVYADSIGRRKVLLAADTLFMLGALCQALTPTVFGMVVGRSLVGLAVGAASMVSSL